MNNAGESWSQRRGELLAEAIPATLGLRRGGAASRRQDMGSLDAAARQRLALRKLFQRSVNGAAKTGDDHRHRDRSARRSWTIPLSAIGTPGPARRAGVPMLIERRDTQLSRGPGGSEHPARDPWHRSDPAGQHQPRPRHRPNSGSLFTAGRTAHRPRTDECQGRRDAGRPARASRRSPRIRQRRQCGPDPAARRAGA